MRQRERTVVLGGTFTPIHDGHRALLHAAFQTASHDGDGDGHLVVALTSSDLASRTRKDPSHASLLGPFRRRREALDEELEATSRAYSASFEVIELDDPQGPAASREDFDALVVSPEGKAQHRAHDVNHRRVRAGLDPLEVHTAPYVIADDGAPISSTRIRNGEIDAHGRLLDDEE